MPENQPSKTDNIVVRSVLEADLDAIMAIENVSFSLPWTIQSYLDMMNVENVRFELIIFGNDIAGYMLYQFWPNGAELHTIAVDEKNRKKGVGTELVAHLLKWAKENEIKKVYLQVRPTNTKALGLYKKFGFKGIARRKHYYTDNDEDAIIMEATV